MTSRQVFDFVLCVPSAIDGSARTNGAIIAPIQYNITGMGDRDKLFIGDVIDVGPGIVVGGEREKMCVKAGDTFLCNLHNLSYKLTAGGRQVYQVRNGVVYASLNPETFEVKPLQDLVLVRANEERALLHMRGKASLPGGELWFPTEAMATDNVRSPAIKLEYGEVVAKGPGRWKDGQWSEPPCKVGDLILYDSSYSTLPVTIRGESFTLVPAGQVAQVADEA